MTTITVQGRFDPFKRIEVSNRPRSKEEFVTWLQDQAARQPSGTTRDLCRLLADYMTDYVDFKIDVGS